MTHIQSQILASITILDKRLSEAADLSILAQGAVCEDQPTEGILSMQSVEEKLHSSIGLLQNIASLVRKQGGET